MATVLLKNNITSQTNVLVITEKFKNEFGLPEKVENYINEQLKKDDVKVVQYNYIGKLVSVFIIDSKLKQNDLNEKLRKHAATFCDALNSNKLTDVYIYNQTKQPNLSLCAAEGLCLANYQFVYHKSNFKKTANTLKTIIVANTKINQTQMT